MMQKRKKPISGISLMMLKSIVVPALLMLAALVIIIYYNFVSNKEQIQATSIASLKQYSALCEDQIQSTINLMSVLQDDPDFLNTAVNDAITQGDDFTQVKRTLLSYINNYEIIDNLYLFNQKGSFVVTANGVTDMRNYFNNNYSYVSYKDSYWNSFLFVDSSPYRILSPSVVRSGETEKNVIPIVFRQVGNTRLRNLLVVNLSLDVLMNNNDVYKYTPNTEIYILNKFNGYLFSNQTDFHAKNITETALYQKLIAGETLFPSKFDNGKNLVIAFSATNSLLGYTYFATVPYADIRNMQLPLILITVVVLLLFLLFASYATFRGTAKIAKPLQKIAGILTPDADEKILSNEKSFFAYLTEKASDLAAQSDSLSMTLPFAQENYLINFLNSTDYTMNEDAQSVIKSSLPFQYSHFAAVVLQLCPTNELYNTYNSAEYANIQAGFYNVVKELFSAKFNIFCLPSAKESLYIILNVPETCTMEDIDEVIHKIYDLLKNDLSAYVNLYIGTGGIHSHLSGLKEAHREALQNLKILSNAIPQITFDTKSSVNVTLKKNDETKLFNYLVGLKIDKAQKLISDTVHSKTETLDNRSLKQLYSQILIIIFNAMKIKNIPVDDKKMDFEVSSEILNEDTDEIYRQILSLLEKFSSYADTFSSKSNGNTIIQYINENYCNPDISLELIATYFHTTSSYVSLTVKNTLGIGFYQYLTSLRIAQSKHLLDTTEDTIQDICTQTGFNSKQTFFRTFKKSVGMTPMEYRKQK